MRCVFCHPVRPFLSVQPCHKLTISTSPASLFVLVPPTSVHPHLTARIAHPPSYFRLRFCTICVHFCLLCQSHHISTTLTSYAHSLRFLPLINLCCIARAGRARGAFLFWGSFDRAPESSFPPRMRVRALFVKWRLLFLESSLRQPYPVRIIYSLPQTSNPRFHSCLPIPRAHPHPQITQLAMVPPPLVDIPQRRPFVHARVSMAATSTKGVQFGTFPSLWLSAVLGAATLRADGPRIWQHPVRTPRARLNSVIASSSIWAACLELLQVCSLSHPSFSARSLYLRRSSLFRGRISSVYHPRSSLECRLSLHPYFGLILPNTPARRKSCNL
jgi:hypothetical protein